MKLIAYHQVLVNQMDDIIQGFQIGRTHNGRFLFRNALVGFCGRMLIKLKWKHNDKISIFVMCLKMHVFDHQKFQQSLEYPCPMIWSSLLIISGIIHLLLTILWHDECSQLLMIKGVLAAGVFFLLIVCMSLLIVIRKEYHVWKMLVAGILLMAMMVVWILLLKEIVDNGYCFVDHKAKEWIVNLIFACYYFVIMIICCIFVAVTQ